ncbi:Rha family transcriptional regulator [Chromobacterium haemolyticum]|uniref:Rha family transcriptional regulator n=1 Tax=Chromobacterium TaxID=535 RepID=UPI00405605CE
MSYINALTVSAANQTQPMTSSEAGTLTMSSREIAELVESRHDKVKQSIERLADRGVIARPSMGDMPAKVANGRTYYETVYHVGKRDSYIVVAQLCPEFTARLVDRWQELEEQVRQHAAPAFQLPQTFEDALILAGQEMKQRKQLEAKLVEDAPKVEAFEEFLSTDGYSTATEAAQRCGIDSAIVLNLILKTLGLFDRRSGPAKLTKKGAASGFFKVVYRKSTRTGHTFPQLMYVNKTLPDLRDVISHARAMNIV